MKAVLSNDAIDIGSDAAPSRFAPLTVVHAIIARMRKAAAARALRRQLQGLDDAILRDIGISEDEIWRVRAGERFVPRAWM